MRDQIGTPEHSLGYLEEIMSRPEQNIVMQSKSFRLNWMGVRVDEQPDAEGDEITVAEFSVRDELRRSAVLVNFSLEQPPAQ